MSCVGSVAIADWAKQRLEAGNHLLYGCFDCFRAVTWGSCHPKAIVTGGNDPNDLPQFRWINTLLGNLKTSFNGTFHTFNFDKYARLYLGELLLALQPLHDD